MSKINPISLAVNVAGVAALLVVGIYTVQSLLEQQTVVSCTQTYPNPTRLTLNTDKGSPLSPIELQGLFGREEWGVLENMAVVRKGSRGSEVLRIKLPAGTSSAFQLQAPRGGAGFVWTPESLAGAKAACLSYRVKFPEDFDFAGAGLLPGLFGGERLEKGEMEGKQGFVTRLGWTNAGEIGLMSLTPAATGDQRRFDDARTPFQTGRPIELATEIVLNTPGEADGILRLWVDGEMKVDARDVDWRGANEIAVSGVAADISYGNVDNTVISPKDTALELSPFELRWR